MGQVRVGTASWTDRTLIESGWYPPEANNPEKRLRYYARQFPLVEVDATYYALPAEQTARAWAERTPPGFTFNIKAFSLFTQHPTPVRAFPADLREAAGSAGKDRVYLKDVDPAVAEAAWDRFLAALGPLRDAGKLGAILLQFPPWFPIGRARREYILACAQRAAPDRVCVEFRNRTWMTEDNQRETLDFLASHQLPYVCVDMPQGYPSSIPPVLAATSDLAVVRMHGHSDKWTSKEISEKFGYKYSDQELDEWAAACATWPGRPRSPTCCSTTATATGRTSTPSSSPRGLPLPHLALDPGQHRGHAAQPQRADQVGQPELAGELGRGGQHLAGVQAIEPGVQDGGEAAGGRRLGRSVEVQVHLLVRLDLNRQEQRRLALRDRLHPVPVPGVALRQGRQVLGELQQQLQPVLVRQAAEIVGDLLQPGIQRGAAGRLRVHGRLGHGLSPRVIGTRTLLPHSVHEPS